eukprot:TRINITY_DN9468_c0_g1_i1.p1 TRINITY_DN9468_c0_g1~~TRINITY_DN9468_c0_g1_i1.p1  ORF type:complete len:337 (+),score=66.22 TRINITY_DN9468_c0_g1_i1:69-1079(+)
MPHRIAVMVGVTRDEPVENCDPGLVERLAAAQITCLSLEEAEKAASEGRGVEGVLVAMHAGLDESILKRLGPNVRVASNYGVGVDHINVGDCSARGVKVGNTPDVLSGTTADLAWALLMATARRVPEADTHARSPGWTVYENNVLLGTDVHGTTLGIVGMGRIGEEVAKRAGGFGMRVLYHNRSRKPAAERALGAQYRSLDELLSESDHVVLVCPLTSETRGLIGAPELRKMKRTATLINVARGPVVDTAALTEALQQKRIFGAGLDVTDPEPLPRDHPLLSIKDGLVILPHRGSATSQARAAMTDLTVRNLLAGLESKPLPAEVQPPPGSKRRRV